MNDAAGSHWVVMQLVWVHPGQEAAFDDFEAAVIPLIAKHGGELVLRLRPSPASVLASTVDPPYEVHVVRFGSEEAFVAFSQDEDRARLLPLKEQAVRATMTIRGRQ